MNKELVFISAQPDETYFSWQIEIFIENIRSLGYKEEIRVLLLSSGEKNLRNVELQERYLANNVKFYWYKGNEQYIESIAQYVPILRPHMLAKHFDENPELSTKAIFYHDSDIIFTNKWDINKFVNDDVQYMSDASRYTGAFYFESRWRFVKSELLPLYQKLNVLVTLAEMVSIDTEIIRKNEHCTGGAQYILKNIDGDFWRNVAKDAWNIRTFLKNNITQFFNDKDQGFNNGWYADMWGVLWNLWKRGEKTSCPQEMNFCWPDCELKNECNIYHDTGINKADVDKFFDKKRYMKGNKTPFLENLDHVSNQHCSSLYKDMIYKVNEKYYKQ